MLNNRGEWRRANSAEMPTETPNRRPLHGARYARSLFDDIYGLWLFDEQRHELSCVFLG